MISGQEVITIIKSQENSKVIPRTHWPEADEEAVKGIKKVVREDSVPSNNFSMEFKIVTSNIYDSWKETIGNCESLINPGEFFEIKWREDYGSHDYVESDYESDTPTIRKDYVKRAFLELVIEETDYQLPKI